MLIGRDKELSVLNKLYDSDNFEVTIIYGEKRVGKTALIKEFIKNKDFIYFRSLESNALQNLHNFSQDILEYENKDLIGSSFDSFKKALEYVFSISKNKRIILVIDEYQNIVKAEKSFAKTLGKLIFENKESSKLFLILSGSATFFLENKILDNKASIFKDSLYKKPFYQMKIDPLDFFDTCKFFKNYSNEDKAIAYGILGGMPQYLQQIDDKLSIEDNIKNTFLNPNSFIFLETHNILRQDLREVALYNAILEAIASGSCKLKDISCKVGESSAVCATYIKNLLTLDLLKKETSYGDKSSKKTIYAIKNHMFNFWYRIVPGNISSIAIGACDKVYRSISYDLNLYMTEIFKDICLQYLKHLMVNKNDLVNFSKLGYWWGYDSTTKSQIAIDIIGLDKDTNRGLFSLCKWQETIVDEEVLNTLINRSLQFNYDKKYYYLFSKKGFTQGCINKAKAMANVELLTLDDMITKVYELT